MKNKGSVLKLAIRLNEIEQQRQALDIEYNQIVKKLWEMIPSLKDDENIKIKKIGGRK